MFFQFSNFSNRLVRPLESEDRFQIAFVMPIVVSYGTMPSERGLRRASGFASARSMRLVAIVLFSSAALITLLALARGPTQESSRLWLLQTKPLLTSNPAFSTPRIAATKAVLAETSSEAAQATKDEVGSEPTEKDVTSFIAKASLDTMILQYKPSYLQLSFPFIMSASI